MDARRLLTLLLLTVLSGVSQKEAKTVKKRSLLELAKLIECNTGNSPLSYLFYGCYCGLGGKGWPKDDLDWCCQKHDCCYGKAEAMGCQSKTDQYQWACDKLESECDSLTEQCERMLCHCDVEIAECLGAATFNSSYAAWPDILCGAEQPVCEEQ